MQKEISPYSYRKHARKGLVWGNGVLFDVKAACYIQIITVLYSVILLTAEVSNLTQKIVWDWLYTKRQK